MLFYANILSKQRKSTFLENFYWIFFVRFTYYNNFVGD